MEVSISINEFLDSEKNYNSKKNIFLSDLKNNNEITLKNIITIIKTSLENSKFNSKIKTNAITFMKDSLSIVNLEFAAMIATDLNNIIENLLKEISKSKKNTDFDLYLFENIFVWQLWYPEIKEFNNLKKMIPIIKNSDELKFFKDEVFQSKMSNTAFSNELTSESIAKIKFEQELKEFNFYKEKTINILNKDENFYENEEFLIGTEKLKYFKNFISKNDEIIYYVPEVVEIIYKNIKFINDFLEDTKKVGKLNYSELREKYFVEIKSELNDSKNIYESKVILFSHDNEHNNKLKFNGDEEQKLDFVDSQRVYTSQMMKNSMKSFLEDFNKISQLDDSQRNELINKLTGEQNYFQLIKFIEEAIELNEDNNTELFRLLTFFVMFLEKKKNNDDWNFLLKIIEDNLFKIFSSLVLNQLSKISPKVKSIVTEIIWFLSYENQNFFNNYKELFNQDIDFPYRQEYFKNIVFEFGSETFKTIVIFQEEKKKFFEILNQSDKEFFENNIYPYKGKFEKTRSFIKRIAELLKTSDEKMKLEKLQDLKEILNKIDLFNFYIELYNTKKGNYEDFKYEIQYLDQNKEAGYNFNEEEHNKNN